MEKRQSVPPLPLSASAEQILKMIKSDDWSFQNDFWDVTFSEIFYVSPDSPLATNLPKQIVVFEALESGQIVMTEILGGGNDFLDVAAFDAPAFAEQDETLTKDAYLIGELSPRRVVMHAELRDIAFFEADQLAAQQMSSLMMPAPMMISTQMTVDELTLGINGRELTVYVPEGFTNRVDIFSSSDLKSWSLATENLLPVSTNPAIWTAPNAECAYFIAGTDVDADADGIYDAREIYLYGTSPASTDSDSDFMPDKWELDNGLDPLSLMDQIADPDHDMLPNVYEYFHGGNPQTNDSHLVSKIYVNPTNAVATNTYASIKEAFTASEAYSVIEVAGGAYNGRTNVALFFPAHPVLLMSEGWGTNRTTIIEYSGDLYKGGPATFMLDESQDNRTIIRGLRLEMSGTNQYQIGFWLGNGRPFEGPGAAPFFDGVTFELGTSEVNIGCFCRHAHVDPVIFNNCVFRGQPGVAVPLRGIYAIDSSPLKIVNCTFQDFSSSPYAYGIQLESTSMNYGEATTPVPVEIVNTLWDESFAAPNTKSAVKLENGVEYEVRVSDSIMPVYPTGFVVDYAANLYITNALLASIGAHQTTNSPGLNHAGSVLTWYDFEGQERGFAPDIGADEFGNYSAGDSDHDGLSDFDEATVYFTDMYNADTDDDSIPDGTEIADGTSATNALNYMLTITGSATNLLATNISMFASCSHTSKVWNTFVSTNIVSGGFVFSDYEINGQDSLLVQLFCDFNTNGILDSSEPFYQQTVIATGRTYACHFTVKDCDGDGIDDWSEYSAGTDPNDPADYMVTISGTFSNDTSFAEPIGISIASGPIGDNVLVSTNVTSTNAFEFSQVRIDEAGSLWVHLFNDMNTNSQHNTGELSKSKMLSVTGETMTVSLELSLDTCDQDKDGMLDFWEQNEGLSWTNTADAYLDPDEDGMYNLHEYWAGTGIAVSNSGYAISDAMFAIDEKLAGLNPTNALHIFNEDCYTTTNFVRNTNCWAYSYDLTCISPWNSSSSPYWGPQHMAGTLITPRHILFAAHFQLTVGDTIRFLDQNNNVVDRTLIAKKNHPDYTHYYPDLTVGILSSDIPTNSICFAKVLPDNYQSYLGNGIATPALCLNQREEAFVMDVRNIAEVYGTYEQFKTFTRQPFVLDRQAFYEPINTGDSGNPAFIILNDHLVLLTVWTSRGGGTAVVRFKEDINQLVADLDLQVGITNQYQLTEIDLSGFEDF